MEQINQWLSEPVSRWFMLGYITGQLAVNLWLLWRD